MTDINKFIELYKSVGIDLIIERYPCGLYLIFGQGDHEKLTGFYGFSTAIKFDLDGKFIEQSFGE